jgi:hypothetical protein
MQYTPARFFCSGNLQAFLQSTPKAAIPAWAGIALCPDMYLPPLIMQH